MDIQRLKSFFLVCTLINGALLVFSALMFLSVPDLAYGVHAEIFSIPQESVGVTIYALVGVYKILFLVFNLVPYLALLLVGKN